jgi:DNA repair exonuclease SbcCD ATPase subunit
MDKTSREILEARLLQLTRKIEAEAIKAMESKERYDEIEALYRSMEAEGITEGLEKLQERIREKFKENQEAVAELRRLQARYDEVQELFGILVGWDKDGSISEETNSN